MGVGGEGGREAGGGGGVVRLQSRRGKAMEEEEETGGREGKSGPTCHQLRREKNSFVDESIDPWQRIPGEERWNKR